MSELKRMEILFLYDVQNANPNGDPADENKPRIDEETGLNIVTDVRLKRTIRDYLRDYKGYNGSSGKDIFIRQTFVDDDDPTKGINDAKNRAKQFANDAAKIKQQCIDIRLFGGVIPLETKKDKKKVKGKQTTDEEMSGGEDNDDKNREGSIKLTGPVQFKMGHSLHKVKLMMIKGTGAFAAQAGKTMTTFREETVLPYSLIAFYGVVNENAAEFTGLSVNDVAEMLEAIWNGTKNLITRSKFEHNPRLLLTVTHDQPNSFIGELDKKVKLQGKVPEEQIRSIEDYDLDFSALKESVAGAELKVIQIDPNWKKKNWI
jgi:CRISPR-associated protein Csh2